MQAYVSIDLETTGLNPKTDKIIEVGAVKVIEGKRTEVFSSFVNPGRKLDEKIAELTGIRDEDLRQAPSIEQVLPRVVDFLGELPLLGHSVLFDFSFLKKAAVNLGIPFEKQAMDTLKISRKYLDGLEHRNLEYLCEYYGIPHQAHRALADARATADLYDCLRERFFSEEEALFQPRPLLYKAKKDSPATEFQKQRLYRLAGQHKISLELEVEMLTKSEASRLIDRILAGKL